MPETADDHRAGNHLGLVEAALLEAGRANVDLAARLHEAGDQVLERREPRLVHVVRIALLGDPRPFRREKDDRFLVGCDRRVGDHEGHGRLVRVVLRAGQADHKTSRHVRSP